MAIQWFPGHMNKARREVKERMSKVDMVIEVLDARLPLSSMNPLIKTLRGPRPVLKILNKADLADQEITDAWQHYFSQEQNTTVMILSTENRQTALKKLPLLCQKLLPLRTGADKPMRAMILGVPNVGKSTLINLLLQRKIAKVADTPGVTQAQQRVESPHGMVLYDTPGLMWPKIEEETAGLKLALSGAIGVNAYDVEEVAYYALEQIATSYPDCLKARYGLTQLDQNTVSLFEAIASTRGALSKGGRIDYVRTAEMIIQDFRSGGMGKISLEAPDPLTHNENF